MWKVKVLTFLVVAVLFLTVGSCKTTVGIPGVLKSRDIAYRAVEGRNLDARARQIMLEHVDWWNAVVAVQNTEKYYASGVCIGINREKNLSYVVSAEHVVRKGWAKTVIATTSDMYSGIAMTEQKFNVLQVYQHKTKDFALLIVDGILPQVGELHREIPPAAEFDILIGYEGTGINNKSIHEGVAQKGQSGGGVFSDTHGLYAVVSTHWTGVRIWPALKEMGFEDVIGIH